MGRMYAEGMAQMTEEGLCDKATALRGTLQGNYFPPIPSCDAEIIIGQFEKYWAGTIKSPEQLRSRIDLNLRNKGKYLKGCNSLSTLEAFL